MKKIIMILTLLGAFSAINCSEPITPLSKEELLEKIKEIAQKQPEPESKALLEKLRIIDLRIKKNKQILAQATSLNFESSLAFKALDMLYDALDKLYVPYNYVSLPTPVYE